MKRKKHFPIDIRNRHWTDLQLLTVIFKTLFVRFIRHSEGAVIVVVVAIYIPRVYVVIERYIDMLEVEAGC